MQTAQSGIGHQQVLLEASWYHFGSSQSSQGGHIPHSLAPAISRSAYPQAPHPSSLREGTSPIPSPLQSQGGTAPIPSPLQPQGGHLLHRLTSAVSGRSLHPPPHPCDLPTKVQSLSKEKEGSWWEARSHSRGCSCRLHGFLLEHRWLCRCRSEAVRQEGMSHILGAVLRLRWLQWSRSANAVGLR